MRAEIPSYVDELPVISATPDTVQDVLTDLIQNPRYAARSAGAAGSSPSNGTRPRRRRSASTRSTGGCCRAGLGPSPFAEMPAASKVTLAAAAPRGFRPALRVDQRPRSGCAQCGLRAGPASRTTAGSSWFARARTSWIFAIRRNRDDRLIGSCQLRQIDRVAGRCELQIRIGDRTSWGHGHGTEAVELLLEHAFDALGLRASSCRCSPATNGPSAPMRRPASAGWRHAGRGRRDRRASRLTSS